MPNGPITLQDQGVYNFTNNAGNTSLQLNWGTTFPFGINVVNGADIDGNLKVHEDIEADGDVVAFSTSDQRLKDNIFIIEDPLRKINTLKGVTFNWNKKAPSWTRKDKWQTQDKQDVGVIAQDVIKVLPEAVKTRPDDEYLAVDYKRLIPLLIESVKELDKKITMLESKLNKLEIK